MSTFSKIFVVINLVLAVAFAVFAVTAYSKRAYYYEQKVQAETATKDLKVETDKEIAKLTAEKAGEEAARKTAESERDSARNGIKQLDVALRDTKTKLADATHTVNLMVELKGVLVKQVEAMRSELADTRKVVVRLKGTETVLRTNNANLVQECGEFRNQVNRARQDLKELHDDRTRIAEELHNAEYVLAALIKKGVKISDVLGAAAPGPVPDVRTKVVGIRPAVGYVAVGAGKASGIKEGFEFLIHRDGELIGKVRITTVWNDFSGGTIVRAKKPIKPGDDAMTKGG